METPLTLRDQIALDIYKLLLVTPMRNNDLSARIAYEYADNFLAEMKAQATAPEATTTPDENVKEELVTQSLNDYLPDGEKEFPFPKDFPPLPRLPKGKSRWAYRGKFSGGNIIKNKGRFVLWWDRHESQWRTTSYFSWDVHHIEAV